MFVLVRVFLVAVYGSKNRSGYAFRGCVTGYLFLLILLELGVFLVMLF